AVRSRRKDRRSGRRSPSAALSPPPRRPSADKPRRDIRAPWCSRDQSPTPGGNSRCPCRLGRACAWNSRWSRASCLLPVLDAEEQLQCLGITRLLAELAPGNVEVVIAQRSRAAVDTGLDAAAPDLSGSAIRADAAVLLLAIC